MAGDDPSCADNVSHSATLSAQEGIAERDRQSLSPHLLNMTPEMVSVCELIPADSPRLMGENGEHTSALAKVGDTLPPILVHRPTMRVIDGMHRVRACVLRGRQQIEACFFEGDEEAAFRLSVELNVKHGLPLTLTDRTAAATRIISVQPQLSDRAIAATAALAPQTVTAIRQRMADETPELSARIGQDGRTRPLNSAEGRRLASMLISSTPEASLREIARAAGIAPATVRDVRARLNRSEDPVPAKMRDSERGPRRQDANKQNKDQPISVAARRADRVELGDRAAALGSLRKDPSLRFNDAGRAFLRWLDVHIVNDAECQTYAAHVPEHSAGLVAALARDCAAQWMGFAEMLEQRSASSA